MKKLNELRNLFIDDRNPTIMKFKEGMSVIWKTTREERPSLRKACSESFLFSGELLRLKDTNKTGGNKEEEQNDTSWILRRTVKVEHSGPVSSTRTELLPAKSCLRRDQQGSQSTPSPNCKRVTFSMYALILTAASQNSVSELQDLLDKKPWYINKPSSSGETALHKAAAKGSLDCVQLLVQRGANVNLVDKQGRTPLLIAWENRHLECHKYMLTSVKLNNCS